MMPTEIAPVCHVDDNGMVTVHDRAAISHSA
jgi:hypothetical protein